MSLFLRGIFDSARKERRACFLPYICVGFPTYALSLRMAMAALDAGSDALELGIPFSDPVADGPTLQRATHRSLLQGTKVIDAFRLIRSLRRAGYHQPILAMTYLNPVERMGWSTFTKALRDAGGDGMIVPDLPTDEMRAPAALLRRHGLALIPFLSPVSPASRVRMAESLKAPFLYYVSVTGVTGARKGIASGLLARLRVLRRSLKTPVVVGFGISGPRQARSIGREAGGVIIASAIIDLVERAPAGRLPVVVGRFCRTVVQALRME